VSEPTCQPAEAYEYLTRLKESSSTPASATATWEGSLRCDANFSVRPGAEGIRHQGEVKNVNSFASSSRHSSTKSSARPKSSIRRQGGAGIAALQRNEAGLTHALERAGACYRYFPEPDLLRWSSTPRGRPKFVSSFLSSEARRARLVAEYGITEQDAGVLTIQNFATSSRKLRALRRVPSAGQPRSGRTPVRA